MIAQHEQQHDETMLATHQLRAGDAGARRAAAATAGRARRRRRRGAGPGRPVHHGHLHRAVGAGQRAAGAPGRRRAFCLDTAPVTNGDYAEFIDAGGYDDPRWWTRPGWAHRQQAGLEAPAVLAARRRQLVAPPVRRASSRCRRDEPVVHVCWYEAEAYARVGRQAAADRGRVGEGRPPRPGDRPVPALPLGRRGPDARARQPRPAPPAPGRGRRLPGRRLAARRPPADRRRVGVDQQRLPPLPRLRRVPVPGVLGGVLRRRLQGAARRVVRHRRGRLPRHVPQLGLPDPPADLRRLPVRPRRRAEELG